MNRNAQVNGPSVRVSLALAAFGVIALAVLYWESGRADREIQALPSEVRAALYDSTLSTLRDTCTHAAGAELTAMCRKSAQLVVRMPECDAACQALAAPHLPQPTR